MILFSSRKTRFAIIVLGVLAVAWLIFSYSYSQKLTAAYEKQESFAVRDRYNKIIAILPNSKGYTDEFITSEPKRFTDLLLKKEDRYFYWHKGVNPISVAEAALGRLGVINRSASSTISQQLVKVLLENENKRTVINKIKETIGALALETHTPKNKILIMYINSIYFGNQIQGVKSASAYYFGKDPEMLTDGEVLSLIATVSNPNRYNPSENNNYKEAQLIGKRLGIDTANQLPNEVSVIQKRISGFSFIKDNYFELSPFTNTACKSSVDTELTDKIRSIVQDNLALLSTKNANNATVVVIKLPENEILTTIGSPDPSLNRPGYRINMLGRPRPIGSTIKPFIYLKAFEKGLRPYTIVNDREYKYITAIGFPLYPKNFDYQYRGEVSLHYALSNSLNVPAVKVLEYVGLNDFYRFLENNLSFKPIQPMSNYQLGIALG
ncbi:MAG: transglycosylase domain-containing protein, partial [bacterium]